MSGAVSPPAPPIARTPDALRQTIAKWRRDGGVIALVPTMGALHDGHLSLMRLARERADHVVASLFVNPAQFAPGEDFEAYPRDEAGDAAMLAAEGCGLLYAPDGAAMYPQGFATNIVVGGPAEGLESESRPHFFHGVATVVAKLLIQVAPDIAVFGEKDYQQLLVIRRLVADLDLAVDILAGPTRREADGLAMSSRNAYLSPPAREAATGLHRTLLAAVDALTAGDTAVRVEARSRAALMDAGFEDVDYVAIRDADTLAPIGDSPLERPARVLAAARLAGVRLIDNVPAQPPTA